MGICSFICSEMSLCQSLSYILAVLNLGFFSLTPTLCCQIQNGLTAKRIEIQTPATSQMKDILTLFLNINKLPPLEKRNIRMNTRERNSIFIFATVMKKKVGDDDEDHEEEADGKGRMILSWRVGGF